MLLQKVTPQYGDHLDCLNLTLNIPCNKIYWDSSNSIPKPDVFKILIRKLYITFL